MQSLTEEWRRTVETIATRHNVSSDAAYHLLMALVAGGGRQAQFNHPDLGGMGQWSQGGMIMVGDMFNNTLKYRVDALCNELATALQNAGPLTPPAMASQSQSQSSGIGNAGGVSLFFPGTFGSRWPQELGTPSSEGSQNDLHYAVFPGMRRLAINQGGRITVYDTGDHQISGFSQQQGGDQSITFTSQYGLVRVTELPVVSPSSTEAAPAPGSEANSPAHPIFAAAPAPASAPSPQPGDAHPAPIPAAPAERSSDDEIFSRIERLADLRKKEILTAEEFDAKKAELLARL